MTINREAADPDDIEQGEIGMANGDSDETVPLEKEEIRVNEKKPVLIKRDIVEIEDSPPAPKRARGERGNDIVQAEARKRQEVLLKHLGSKKITQLLPKLQQNHQRQNFLCCH